ncbi:MAG: polyketide cyclase [Bacteroidetes bacterium]|nr:polyketide cyclase [Bacteroidota bacterium]
MIVLYVLAGLVLVLIVLMLVAPKGAKLERAIVANVSPEQAFQSLRSLKNFDEWSPWNNRDPNQIRGYKGKEGELGSIAWWKGNKEVGEGEQEVKLLDPNSYIETELRFQKTFQGCEQVLLADHPRRKWNQSDLGF